MPATFRIFRAGPAARPIAAAALLVLVLLATGCQTRAQLVGDGRTVTPPTQTVMPVQIPAAPLQSSAVPPHVDPAEPGACCLRANLWDRIRAGFRFDLAQDNDRIAAQRNWYLRNPQYLDRVIARGSRYLHHIVEETEARDMPMELALLPVVESAFDPFAYSVADAAGPWQFIPSTGRVFGLRQDWWYDGRRDIVYSTTAALSYLEQLAARFDGDYYKALASYNAGGGTISRAITRNLRAGKRTDYWSLKVPQETAAYVPKLIALAQIVQNPEKYGVRLNPIPDEPRFVAVDLPAQIDLARAAELAGIPLSELYLFNPAHSRWLTDPVGPHRLLVPVEVADDLRAALARAEPDEFVFMLPHTVAAGETLESIAARYLVPMEALRAVNEDIADSLLPAGSTIAIPQPRLSLAASDMTYEARIVALNQPGKSRRTGGVQRYIVKRGDTLSGIARKHSVAVRDLARWNDMSISKPLSIGQKLTIRGGSAVAQSRPSQRESKKATTGGGGSDRRVNHTVRRGETLSSLSRKFNVSVHDIARWNDFSPSRQLRIGERLKLYID